MPSPLPPGLTVFPHQLRHRPVRNRPTGPTSRADGSEGELLGHFVDEDVVVSHLSHAAIDRVPYPIKFAIGLLV